MTRSDFLRTMLAAGASPFAIKPAIAPSHWFTVATVMHVPDGMTADDCYREWAQGWARRTQ